MTVAVKQTDAYIVNAHTRMPFHYGIAKLKVVPHFVLRATLEVDGRTTVGWAADHLPPKWFTKNPDATFEHEISDMIKVILSACAFAETAHSADTAFSLWARIYDEQRRAARRAYPPLLWGFGVSMVERAVIDAVCRAMDQPFAAALRSNAFGINLGKMHGELDGKAPADFLPEEPVRSILLRHTVGLGDPLTDGDIPDGERLDDGLPQSLEASIRHYGLKRFKIKVRGDVDQDVERLTRLAAVLDEHCEQYAFTLDGNEQYTDVEPFIELWEKLQHEPRIAPFMSRLLFVEQPLHRKAALSADAIERLSEWPHRPPIIIDESGGPLDALPRALRGGYAGVSHKNCKGVFKGVANACLVEHRRRSDPAGRYVISSEDLNCIGPISLQADLAVAAALGITHTERNAQHYYRGLSMWADDVQQQMLDAHGDFYHRHEAGFVALHVRDGAIDLDSIVDAPFGTAFELDPTPLTPLDDWDFASLGLAE